MIRLLATFAGTFALLVVLGHPAGAVALVENPGVGGPSLSIGGETFTESSCAIALCADLVMVQDGTSTGVTIEAATSSNPSAQAAINAATGCATGIFLCANAPANRFFQGNDITLSLIISGTTQINDIGVGITGSAPDPSDFGAVNVGETGTAGGNGLPSGSASLGTPGDIAIPAGFTSVDLTKDIQIAGAVPIGGLLQVASVTQDVHFRRPIPEPASALVFLVGVTVSAAAWRRQRRA
jgi:hypothetical protein